MPEQLKKVIEVDIIMMISIKASLTEVNVVVEEEVATKAVIDNTIILKRMNNSQKTVKSQKPKIKL